MKEHCHGRLLWEVGARPVCGCFETQARGADPPGQLTWAAGSSFQLLECLSHTKESLYFTFNINFVYPTYDSNHLVLHFPELTHFTTS